MCIGNAAKSLGVNTPVALNGERSVGRSVVLSAWHVHGQRVRHISACARCSLWLVGNCKEAGRQLLRSQRQLQRSCRPSGHPPLPGLATEGWLARFKKRPTRTRFTGVWLGTGQGLAMWQGRSEWHIVLQPHALGHSLSKNVHKGRRPIGGATRPRTAAPLGAARRRSSQETAPQAAHGRFQPAPTRYS